jgi:hypothetical protein
MDEEYGTFKEIISKICGYYLQDKKRLVKLGLYLIYMYLFTKRFFVVIQYFKKLILRFLVFIRLIKRYDAK